jgi:hypothetical protein
VETLAPYTCTTHFKDMAVSEYADGFLLSEVPLGSGFLDLARIVRILRGQFSDVHFNLEMITRDPLEVPCLTAKYWATFETLPGRHLARMLRTVRGHAAVEPLPRVSGLDFGQQLRVEDDNVRRSIEFARELPMGSRD